MAAIAYRPDNKEWDLIIIGAGPVGMSAARAASNLGLQVIVLEAADRPGPIVRAETVRNSPILQAIWGSDFLTRITLSICSVNVFHSPGNEQNCKMIMLNTPHCFHWQELIGSMYRILTAPGSGVTFAFDTAVKRAVLPDDESLPVRAVETTRGLVYGHTILDCSGHTTVIGRQLGIDYGKIINPILKARYSNFPYAKYPDFHTFFISAGTLLPQAPPAMAGFFPAANGETEVACQFFHEFGPGGLRSKDAPPVTEQYLLNFWKELSLKAPGLADMMQGLKEEYLYITGIPSRHIIADPMIYPGLVLTGDAAGCIDTESSSGLISGMHCANFWVMAAAKMRDIPWTQEKADYYAGALQEEGFFREYSYTQQKISFAKSVVYGLFRTSQAINRNWSLVRGLYNMNTKKQALERSLEEYKVLEWQEQSAHINAILSGMVVLQQAENTILSFLGASKKKLSELEWQAFTATLFLDRLFEKFQGAGELGKVYKILGNLSRVQCALVRNSKLLIVRDVTRPALKEASLNQRSGLVSILIHSRPLGREAQEKLLAILEITREENGPEAVPALLNELGGPARIVRYVSDPAIKKKIDALLE